MADRDSHVGGDLSDMAATGTKIPNDAGDYKILPSVPDKHQQAEHSSFHNQFINAADPDGAADNATDMPRSVQDTGDTGEVITGIGDQMPPDVERKRFGLDEAAGPAAKGDARDGKARKEKDGDGDRFVTASHEVDPAPGEENEDQEAIRQRKGL